MVSAFHGGGTLEIARANGQQRTNLNASDSIDLAGRPPPASAFTVMAGSVVPAVLMTGINSGLARPILAQVSQNVFDSATGNSVVPQGSRLIGDTVRFRLWTATSRNRVERLIFPDTSSMTLPRCRPRMGWLRGFHRPGQQSLLATFGTAALMSLISAGQQVGQMAAFGGGGASTDRTATPSRTSARWRDSRPEPRIRTVRCSRAADDRPGDEPPADDRNTTRLPVQRDGHRGPRLSRSLQELNVHKSYTKRMWNCARNVHKNDLRRTAMGVLKRKEEPTER